MVVNIAIKGGLGNQLFQYALGCYFGQQHHASVFYDTWPLNSQEKNLTPRHFLLDQLFDKISFTDRRVHDLFYSQHNSLPVKLYKKLFRTVKHYHYISESDFLQLQLSNNATYYFDGYWQQAQLAAGIREQVNACTATVLKNNHYAEAIRQAGESVAIHIRRGDYVNNAFINSYHGHCDLDYYTKAMVTIENKTAVDRYFIFSDDTAWAKQNISSKHSLVFVEGDTEAPVTDLFLMKSCRHQIIANSSFSCWASYLNSNPNKVVIAPIHWTRHQKTSELPLSESIWTLI